MPVRRVLLTLTIALLLAAVLVPDALAVPWPGGVQCTTTGPKRTPFRDGLNCRTFRFNGVVRRYVAWMPQGSERRVQLGARLKTVTMLHGSSGTGEQFFNISGWREKADSEHFVAIFPTGQRYVIDTNPPARPRLTKWADFDLVDDVDETVTPPADDVGFLHVVMNDVAASTHVNARRAYIAGFSNGAKMCFRASLEMSDVYAAAACHAGASNHPQTVAPGKVRLPLALSIGNIDDDLLAGLQAGHPGIMAIPMNPVQAYALIGGGVAMDITSVGLAGTPYRVITVGPTRFTLDWATPLPGNTDGNDMSFSLVKDVTHEYPSCTGRPPNRRCNNPHHFNAPDLVWPFLSAHVRP